MAVIRSFYSCDPLILAVYILPHIWPPDIIVVLIIINNNTSDNLEVISIHIV